MKETILSSSILILLLILLRRLLRGKIDPRVQYALWLLAAARLLIPGTLFSAPVSVAGAAAELETVIRGEAVMPEPAPYEANLLPAVATAGGSIAAAGKVPQIPAVRVPAGGLEKWLGLVWKIGMGVMGAALLLSNLRFYLSLRRRRMEIECGPLRAYVVKDLASPCLFGLLRPAVYLTPQAAKDGWIDYVMAHEYTHFRHGDHWWALLRSVCLVVHWYNPLVWWAASLCRRDCELACDAGAIRRLGEERRLDYGAALLRMVPAGRNGLLCAATTMSAGKRTMKERVTFIARRPRMLKITLMLVVLAMCGLAAVTFGGMAEKPGAPQDNDTGPDLPQEATEPVDVAFAPAPAVTEDEALELYAKAREAWDWFDLGTIPLTNDTYVGENGTLNRVEGFGSAADLMRYLETLFTPEIAEYLFQYAGPFVEHDGGLYMLDAGRGSSVYAGQELVSAFVYSPEEAELYGYSIHIFAQTEVLGEDLNSVLGYKRHDFFAVWNGENFVFSSFGPWDDTNPQVFYNAREIRAQIEAGADTGDWLPLMSYMDWSALAAESGSELDLGEAVRESLYSFIQEKGADLTMAQYLYILSATEGLDGAAAEGFQSIVYDLCTFNPSQFAYVVLEQLPQAQRDAVVDFYSWEWALHREDSEIPSREETLNHLEANLMVGVSASLVEKVLTYPGETFPFQMVNANGVYAASYTSANPDVAAVDQNGTVTAVGVGETTITLHYEGAGGQQDFICAVSCQW